MQSRSVLIGGAIALAVAAVLGVLALTGGDEKAARPAQAPARQAVQRTDRFDSARAWAELERQVALGPRPAGSPVLRQLAARLKDELPNGRFERVPGHPGLRNVVGKLRGRRPAVVVAAHYDTKDLPGFVGANDGAAGTAVVMELARVLNAMPRAKDARQVRFVLFDGEEATDDSRPFVETGIRGSRAYARSHHAAVKALILLDFVGNKHLRIRREALSDPVLWGKLRAAAKRVGAASAFPPGTGAGITDDHLPFLHRGVPSIDLIQWPYACWHKACDDVGAVEERSLDLTGETVLELVRTLRRR